MVMPPLSSPASSPLSAPLSIVVVDDEPDNFEVIEALLSPEDYQLHYAPSGEVALASLELFQPDLILLDVMMPGMDGIAVCQQLKGLPQWQGVPIIMVTALASKQDLARCLAAGADDFIGKPVSAIELRARVRSMLRIRQQFQQLTHFNSRLETTVQHRTRALSNRIYRDSVTQLPSRASLLQTLQINLDSQQGGCAVIYLDCDQFKLVNGSFGHGVGDQLLVAIAQRLQPLAQGQMLARIGEDEFCFLLSPVPPTNELDALVQRIHHSFGQPFQVDTYEIFITACLGIAQGRSAFCQPEQLLQDAEMAMYQAKLRGKNSHQMFDAVMRQAIVHRLQLENDLQHAVQRDEFVLHYQPIMALDGLTLVGFEALVRWQHPQRGMVSPGEFISSLETTGLIVPVGMVVLRKACQQLYRWHRQGWGDLTMSVNLSVRQFASTTLLADVDRVLVETGVNPARLKLEITESAIMDNAEAALAITRALRDRQINICIDDFGTGYSSLGYLHRFPADVLKIDRSFVNTRPGDSRNYRVVETIIGLSQQLGLTVVAEGIERDDQLTWLRNLGCEMGQGVLFSMPLPADEATAKYCPGPVI